MRNIPASVRQRLLNLSKQRHEEFQNVLTRYAIERFLFRLGESPHSNRFLLKGALLFYVWSGEPHRPTWDLDLLGSGDNSIPTLERIFREVSGMQSMTDGIEFLEESIRGSRIREDQEYEGIRIQMTALLAGAESIFDISLGRRHAPDFLPKPVNSASSLQS